MPNARATRWTPRTAPALPIQVTDPARAPRWVEQLVGSDTNRDCRLAVSNDGRWSLLSGTIQQADALSDEDLQQATVALYSDLLTQLRDTSAPHPVRAWNLVPTIHRTQRPGCDRYMAFNAGRHAAYAAWFGCEQRMASAMPTASAVGYDGRDLVVHLLGHDAPGQAIENPRQVPAFRYSQRFGKVPPSFVRATVMPEIDGCTRVFVAGTASVVGEDSHHPGDLNRQLAETFRNLATVMLRAAQDPRPINGHATEQEQEALTWYRSVRVYVRREQDLPRVYQTLQTAIPSCHEIELVRADICRPELLAEIEGVGVLPQSAVKPDQVRHE